MKNVGMARERYTTCALALRTPLRAASRSGREKDLPGDPVNFFTSPYICAALVEQCDSHYPYITGIAVFLVGVELPCRGSKPNCQGNRRIVCHVERSRDISQHCWLREIVRDSSTALGMRKALGTRIAPMTNQARPALKPNCDISLSII